MGDEFDACECVWSHEFAMQRLLAFIRQSQNHCTDTECIDVTGRTTRSTGNEESNFTMMTMLMLFALLMYYIRPESILKLTNVKRRTQGRDQHDGDNSPPPPPAPPAVN